MKWPPNYKAEWQRRYKLYSLLMECDESRSYYMVYYKGNPAAWINDFCVTYDPRKKAPEPRTMPFILFPRQIELVDFLFECFETGESGLIEKARDMGATWVAVCFSLWLFFFHGGTSVGWGSRKSDLVDEIGNPDSIFEKMRIVIRNLPGFMLPEDFSVKNDCPYMKIINRYSESNIAGESGDNIGRGGRSTIYFKDEAAHYERPEKIEAALGDNTDVQIDISSVNGLGNVFARRREVGEEWEKGKEILSGRTRVFIMDWRDHPAKTQEWYDKRKSKYINEGMAHVFAQEVDRDYAGSVDNVVIPAQWVKAAIDAHKVLGFKPEGEKVAMQDVADGGMDKNALVMRHGVVCTFAEHWGGEAGDAAQKAVPFCIENKITELYYDSIGVGVGFKVEINNMKLAASWPSSLSVSPWNAGSKPLDPEDNIIIGDMGSPLNKDQYLNLKAQSWFRVRARFYKTFQAVVHGKTFPHSELISISSEIECVHKLVRELSQARRKKNGEGKTIIEKTPSGAKSPNLADSFIACYNPTRELSILDVL